MSHFTAIASLISVLAGAPCALADEFDEDPFGASGAAPWEFRGPGGKVAQALSAYLQPVRGYSGYQERLDLELEGTLSNQEYTGKLIPWAWLRVPDAVGGLDRRARAYFEVKEGWVERVSPSWDLRIGNQILTWGAADQVNPTDVWNAWDTYDIFQRYKLPQAMAKANFHPVELVDWITLEAIFTPFFRENMLPLRFPESGDPVDMPLAGSRWLLPVPSRGVKGDFSAPLTYKLAPASFPETWQAGAKLQFLRLGGWDFSTSYFNGVERNPRIAITSRGDLTSPNLPIVITLHPSYHRTEMFGVDGSGSENVWGFDFGLRFELAYFARDNSRVGDAPASFRADLTKDDYFHGVAGVDHTFKKKILDTVLYANLMYVHYQRVTSREAVVGQTILENLPNVFPWDQNLVLYVEDRITPTLKATVTAIGSLANQDGYLNPGIQLQISDAVKASLTGDFFVGSTDGFYGQFEDNRRVNTLFTLVF